MNHPPTEYARLSLRNVQESLADTPVVLINGPRQSGKTTLARRVAGTDRTWLTLDDETQLSAALADPVGFLRGYDAVAIDEVQRAPALLRAIKHSVDNDRRPGRFLLTGSTDVLTLPHLSDSLAGRMAVIDLLPLAQAEIQGHQPTFLARAFAGAPPETDFDEDPTPLEERVLRGGYPEMVSRPSSSRRLAWAKDYVRAIIQRDVRDIANIDKLDRMAPMLRALARQSGQLTSLAPLGGALGLDQKTVSKYLGILEQLFLVRRIEPWFRNEFKRMVKTPKLHFLDSGLLASLRGITPEKLQRNRGLMGPLLETFAHAELAKLTSWMEGATCTVHHYRDKDQEEVDFVLENDSGEIIGVEVKAAASVNSADFSGLRKLSKLCGEDFRSGVVLYDGDRVVSFGNDLYAAPFSCLWT